MSPAGEAVPLDAVETTGLMGWLRLNDLISHMHRGPGGAGEMLMGFSIGIALATAHPELAIAMQRAQVAGSGGLPCDVELLGALVEAIAGRGAS